MFFIKIVISVCLLSSIANGQNTSAYKTITFMDDTGPVQDVVARYQTENDSVIVISDLRGQISTKSDVKRIYVSHINYDSGVVAVTDTIYLKAMHRQIKEVVISNEKEKNKTIISVLRPFMDFEINFGYNSMAAVFIPHNTKYRNKKIREIKYEIVDILGVKNLKYLPFKAALYSVDTVQNQPDVPLFESDTILKQNNKKWVSVNVSKYNFEIPAEGIFIVFQTFGPGAYPQEYIEAKGGIINAVPAVRAKLYDVHSRNKSYIFKQCENCEEESQWEFIKCHFVMDIEYEK